MPPMLAAARAPTSTTARRTSGHCARCAHLSCLCAESARRTCYASTMRVRAQFIVAIGLGLASCASPAPTKTAPSEPAVPSNAPHIVPVEVGPDVAPAGGAAHRCLPVVAAECGCTYDCGDGVEIAPGAYEVTHAVWAPSTVRARIKPWCVAGDCTDAFFGEIVCSGICTPKPARQDCACR